jgi:hypothetical protein
MVSGNHHVTTGCARHTVQEKPWKAATGLPGKQDHRTLRKKELFRFLKKKELFRMSRSRAWLGPERPDTRAAALASICCTRTFVPTRATPDAAVCPLAAAAHAACYRVPAHACGDHPTPAGTTFACPRFPEAAEDEEGERWNTRSSFLPFLSCDTDICDITIYFCNIHLKHLQHASETLEIYTCNMCFFTFSSVRRRGERGTASSGQRRTRMVTRPSSSQLRLRLAWARASDAPSPDA